MDGLDLSTIDEIDQDAFNGSPNNSDDEDELPLPDCIGIDSAVQDDEQTRILNNGENKMKRVKTRSEIERELEVKGLKPDSIRRQILEQSLKNGNNRLHEPGMGKPDSDSSSDAPAGSHVMNIVEKAGMSGIDKDRINEIIHEASKGSLFYKKQAQRQEEIHKSIEKMLTKVKNATPLQVTNAKITCDKMIVELEKQRIFNRVIVHFDLDMFFAAVEIRDNPELADKPIAVGGDSMVSTSNYIARRYGVRAAMPGFIARKLCPELLLIKPNGSKYRQASSEVFSVLEEYDPELTCMSLDEAYLDLTDYVKNTLERDGLETQEYYDGTLPRTWWIRAGEVVEEIRESIYNKTKLTCSAGISCNTLLAKISTDINKPNGQFMVQGYADDVSDFIKKTPVGKVSGIGKVSGQFLGALEIQTCGDIYEKRHFLPLVFYEINVKFYLRVAIGDGSTCIKSDEQRKSKSVERTFSAIKDTLILLDKLDSICEELCVKYLKPYRIRGRTITIKLKRNTFTTTTKSYSMLVPTNDKLVIFSAAKNLLLAEIAQEPPEISYRLLGVKLSNLADEGVTTNQLTIDAMLRNQELSKQTKSEVQVYKIAQTEVDALEPKELDNNSQGQPDLENNPESEKVDCDATGDDCTQEDVQAFSKKRKEPSTKRIEEFFSRKQAKGVPEKVTGSNIKVANEARLSGQAEDLDYGKVIESEKNTEPNALSQTEQMENQPNDEDFQCPFCFKPFSDFNILESHVDKCYLKNSIDIYKHFATQRPVNIPISNVKTSLSPSSGETKSSQASTSRKTNTRKRQAKLKFSTQNLELKPPSPSLSQPCGSSPKISFYQKFIESNSPTLSLSPKIEPFQCPFCRHGFLNFRLLENHSMICAKNICK